MREVQMQGTNPERTTTTLPDGRPQPRVRAVYTYLVRVSVAVLVLTLIGSFIGAILQWDVALIGIPIGVGLSFLIILGFGALFAGAAKKAITRILTDEQTIHWTYSEQEWRDFTTQAWRRNNRTILITVGILVGVVAVIDLVILLAASGNSGALIVLPASLGVAAAVYLLLFLREVLILWSRHRQTTSDVYIHPAGLIIRGWYNEISRLEQIKYRAGDPALLGFVVRRQGRYSSYLASIDVPVPHGREAEAEHLAQSSQKECALNPTPNVLAEHEGVGYTGTRSSADCAFGHRSAPDGQATTTYPAG